MSESEPARASHRRSLLEAAIQGLPIGVVVHDSHGLCILANGAAAALQEAATQDVSEAACAEIGEAPKAGVVHVDGRTIEVQSRKLQSEHEDYCLTTLVDITQHHGLQRELLERAFIDSLTGLPNRILIEQSVEDTIAAIAPGEGFALAFIDVDNFKHINDYYSHATGDALLTKIADRICNALRPSDMLARVGGDEFVLLINPASDADSIKSFVRNIADRLKQPFFIDGHEVFASASIGVSLFPDHGQTYDVLRRQADNAMYRVKGGVKGGVSVFEATMAEAATARMEVEQRLRLAIRDRCFLCAFQPKVDLRTGEVQGVEVLLRWRDDQGVIQAPGDFVGLAVELGLINEITVQVLTETVRSMADIDEVFGPDVSVSINIAAKQACDVAFMHSFCDRLKQTGYAERFVLELTEEAFFTKGRFQEEVLPRIRAVGAKVSIDDFGVGYSSLAALAEITADELKIDRSFIKDIHKRPRSQIVLKAIESLGLALGMSIVAEGVETFEEVAYLQAATQIRCAQGFYYSRPMLIEQMRVSPGRVSPVRDVHAKRQLFSSRPQFVRSRA